MRQNTDWSSVVWYSTENNTSPGQQGRGTCQLFSDIKSNRDEIDICVATFREVTRLSSRVTIDLAAQQNKDAGCYGKKRQDNSQPAHRNKRRQACENKPYGQQ